MGVSKEKERQCTDSFYKGLKGAASIPTDDLIPPTERSRNHHSLTFQTHAARTEMYKGSFFPQTEIGMPFQFRSITSIESAEGGVSRFTCTSLVRATRE